ncbi:uncharacterized protein LODBEIA_P23720 [Lodderomyces beijingensis]|uniref:AB hydrolase-1 domain-containing protein n=1 Tax=Lodderomyces beijingensis TaxID=1775926 RepID=A0ABP0ZKH5_9ASCO
MLPISQLRLIRRFSLKNASSFTLPQGHKPNKALKTIPFSRCLDIWRKSWSANNLEILQDELVRLMMPVDSSENSNVTVDVKKLTIDKSTKKNEINEVGFKVVNGKDLATKHVVFIHGYGASLGCFARNFQMINQLKKSTSYNYHVHFLDNITFGLSSNPSIDNDAISWRIPATASMKMIDKEDPKHPKKLYRKYYKLIDGFQLDPKNFSEYQQKFKPILQDMENFYCSAIDNWRQASGISKIDFLVGHSFGGFWSGSYALKFPNKVDNVILLSPVGVERNVMAITNPDKITTEIVKPTLDPTSYRFLSRFPILSKNHVLNWYYKIPFLPRLLPLLGPWGVKLYFEMWLPKLSKINKLIAKHGGAQAVFTNTNDLVYGSKREIELIVEYLYNATTRGCNSDLYVKYLLTPATVSKWPLYDKFMHKLQSSHQNLTFNLYLFYGEYDFMNSEAGQKLIEHLNTKVADTGKEFKYDEIAEGGHNLYIDNPFDTNRKISEIILNKE